eukprot:Gb_33793 [translate_table: standard]
MLRMSFLWALILLISGDDVSNQISITGSNTLGINYGQIANNLPPPESVVKILESVKDKQSEALRFEPGYTESLCKDGSRIRSGALMAQMVPAMQSIHSALGLDTTVKISTAYSLGVLGNLYPPSAGFFKPDLTAVVKPLLDFLSQTGATFWINAYPYFAYKDNPGQVSLDYVLFQPNAGITCSMPMWMRFILRLLPWVMLIWKSESQRPDGLLKAIPMKPELLLRMPRSITKTFCNAKLRTRGLP